MGGSSRDAAKTGAAAAASGAASKALLKRRRAQSNGVLRGATEPALVDRIERMLGITCLKGLGAPTSQVAEATATLSPR